jgi:hypothetical protein
MDELIKLVSKKVKIPEAQARQAVETVLGFLKDKLPAPIAAQIDGVLGGKKKDPGDVGKTTDVLGDLGGLLGGKKK